MGQLQKLNASWERSAPRLGSTAGRCLQPPLRARPSSAAPGLPEARTHSAPPREGNRRKLRAAASPAGHGELHLGGRDARAEHVKIPHGRHVREPTAPAHFLLPRRLLQPEHEAARRAAGAEEGRDGKEEAAPGGPSAARRPLTARGVPGAPLRTASHRRLRSGALTSPRAGAAWRERSPAACRPPAVLCRAPTGPSRPVPRPLAAHPPGPPGRGSPRRKRHNGSARETAPCPAGSSARLSPLPARIRGSGGQANLKGKVKLSPTRSARSLTALRAARGRRSVRRCPSAPRAALRQVGKCRVSAEKTVTRLWSEKMCFCLGLYLH